MAEDARQRSMKAKSTENASISSSKSLLGKKSTGSNAFQLLESQGIIVGKTLGSGSYAKVKSAYDINRKHKVAVKIITKKKAFDEYLHKFLPREIEAMKALNNHYALVKFYQIIETTSRYFFIMELAEKGDLLTEIKTRKNIPEEEAGQLFVNLYDGLKFMHGKGIVHRDIKCENLVIDSKKVLKITDFGFAKKMGKTKGGGPLLSETYCGSYAYAPPEILKGIPYNPAASDVWSMGVVLFTMIYGRLPFDDSDHKRLMKQVEKKVQFPCKPDVSNKCRILIVKILTKASERVPLKSIKSDPWFQEHNALHVLAGTMDAPGMNCKSTSNVIDKTESVISKVEEATTDNVDVELSNKTSKTQNKLQLHSVESHEILKCDKENDIEENG